MANYSGDDHQGWQELLPDAYDDDRRESFGEREDDDGICSRCGARDDTLYPEHVRCPECDDAFCRKCAELYCDFDADCVGDQPRFVDRSTWRHCDETKGER